MSKSNRKIKKLLKKSAKDFKKSFDKKPKPQVLEQLKNGASKILLSDTGNCPYKGTLDSKGICAISLQWTNDAVQCDFEFENCELYKKYYIGGNKQ